MKGTRVRSPPCKEHFLARLFSFFYIFLSVTPFLVVCLFLSFYMPYFTDQGYYRPCCSGEQRDSLIFWGAYLFTMMIVFRHGRRRRQRPAIQCTEQQHSGIGFLFACVRHFQIFLTYHWVLIQALPLPNFAFAKAHKININQTGAARMRKATLIT